MSSKSDLLSKLRQLGLSDDDAQRLLRWHREFLATAPENLDSLVVLHCEQASLPASEDDPLRTLTPEQIASVSGDGTLWKAADRGAWRYLRRMKLDADGLRLLNGELAQLCAALRKRRR